MVASHCGLCDPPSQHRHQRTSWPLDPVGRHSRPRAGKHLCSHLWHGGLPWQSCQPGAGARP
eukprot:1740917-Heterocapsa_arctica.AAC.1